MADPRRYGLAADLADALDRLDPAGGWATTRRAGVGEMLAAVHNLRSSGPRVSHENTPRDELLAAVANVLAGRCDMTPANTSRSELKRLVSDALGLRRTPRNSWTDGYAWGELTRGKTEHTQ